MTQPNAQNKDYTQAIKESYDPALERLRVDALINDGTDALVINADGSINVNVVPGSPSTSTYDSLYDEVTSVASAVLTTIQTYTASSGGYLEKICVSGTNIAEYQVVINSVVQDKRRTYFGDSLNGVFDFQSFGAEGYPLVAGDIVEVKVIHSRPMLGDFNSRLQVIEV